MLIPANVDVPMDRRPIANWTLIGVIVIVTLIGFTDSGFLRRWSGAGLFGMGSQPTLTQIKLAITSSFLHAGIIHLLGNMLFLWVFGNAINYKFGHLGYLALYLGCALVGGLSHYVIDGRAVIGASGAIYGIMGAFLMYFPRNEVTLVWIIPINYNRGGGYSSCSSGWIIAFWVIWDLVRLMLGAGAWIALWAHLAGFAAGLGIAVACYNLGWVRPTEDEQTLAQAFGRTR